MRLVPIILTCSFCLLPQFLAGQRFSKIEKHLSGVLNEVNNAYEIPNLDKLKESRFERKLQKLRTSYAQYHSRNFDERDSLARLNNEAVLLALSGNRNKAIQLLQSHDSAQSLLHYHHGLTRLLHKEYDQAAEILYTSHAENASLNFTVAQGYRTVLSLGVSTGFDPKGKQYFNNGVLLIRKGRWEEAIQHFSKAIEINDLAIYRLTRGEAYLHLGKLDEAWADFSRGSKRDVEFNLRRGFTLLQKEQFTLAQKVFQKCLKSKDPKIRYPAMLGLANSHYAQQHWSLAKNWYEQASLYKPLVTSAQMGLANIAMAEKKYQSARNIYDRIINTDSLYLDAYLGRALAAYGLKDFELAQRDFVTAKPLFDRPHPQLATWMAYRGWTSYYRGDPISARNDFTRALSIDGNCFEAHGGLGQIEIEQRQFAKAGTHLNNALTHEPENDRLWVNYGNLLLHFGMFDKAYSVFEKAVAVNRLNVQAQNGRGITLLEKDHLEQSKALFDSLLKTNPGQSVLLNNRGIAHAYLGNKLSQQDLVRQADFNYQLAEKDFDKALQNTPSKRFYHVNKGNVFRYWHQYEEARQSYQTYQDKSALNNTAVLLAGLEKYNDARYYMGVALQIDSTHRVFHYNMNLLNQGKAKEQARFLASSRDSGPYTEISIKYSLDGYVTIYLYDYEYQRMYFPVRHSFPSPDYQFQELRLIPELDYSFIPYTEKMQEKKVKRKSAKTPKIKWKGRARSGTKCPVF